MENLIQKNPQPYTYVPEVYKPSWKIRTLNRIGVVRIVHMLLLSCYILAVAFWLGAAAVLVHLVTKYWK